MSESATTPRIHPVILSGGVGARLWPMSRAHHPKQLLPLAGARAMIQDTVLRARGPAFGPPIVICNDAHRFLVAELLTRIGADDAEIVLEPVGRNTAPAAAIAAMLVMRRDPEGLMLVMPSDHVVRDGEAFLAAVATAEAAARGGRLVTFGIAPDRPETGYGYIRAGGPIRGVVGARTVARFVEKPDRATAESYLADGGYSWNSGMFLFPARLCLAEIARFVPAVAEACEAALAAADRDLGFLRLEGESFARAPSISIDYAVMERTERAAVVPVDMGWSDVGAWPALWEIGAKDESGNVLVGDVFAEDTRGSYVRAEGGPMTAVVGLRDAIVVVTEDAVLVASREGAHAVKDLVDRMREAKRPECVNHTTIFRPWGSYRTIDMGDRFQVKQILVKPGGVLSLQYHHHRSEHWVVVEGTARVTSGDRAFLLHENQSTHIPLGQQHRLENPGKVDLRIIEVQSGAYLGEDDIVRLEDAYGRP